MKQIFAGLVLCLGGALSLFGQIETQAVAIINLIRQEPITVRQLKAELTPLEQAEGRTFTVAERREALDMLISQRLILQAAERDRITVSENEIDNALKNYLAQQAGRNLSEAEYAQALRQAGTNVPQIRQQASKQLVMQKYLMAKRGDQINTLKEPTEDEIARWYNINKSELRWPDIVRLSLIAVPYGADSTTKAKARETANRLVREIGTNPNKFDEAVLRGIAAGSGVAAAGGDNYVSTRDFYIRRTREFQTGVGENFFNTAFSLKQGEVSPLIEGISAYQIIKVTDIYAQKFLGLEDIIDPENPIRVREYIQQLLMAEQQQQQLNKAFAELVEELRKGRNAVTINEQYLNW
ncbi:MAG: SurA N-terminal domain-containing protein [Treponema sp.]|jgi:parvulin-like peptidyl-prolyl isomerase|nr:SurA N-terminal domain-containing protein [Treponema sp.]